MLIHSEEKAKALLIFIAFSDFTFSLGVNEPLKLYRQDLNHSLSPGRGEYRFSISEKSFN